MIADTRQAYQCCVVNWEVTQPWFVFVLQAEQDIAGREKNAEQLQDELAAQDESITKLSKEKKALEEAKQVRYIVITGVF